MAIHKFNPLTDARWPEFLERHPQASIFHTPAWLMALQRTYKYEPVVFTTSPQGAELSNAVLVCQVQSCLTGCRLVSLPFSDHCQPLANDTELEDILLGLERRRTSERWKYIELRPLDDFTCRKVS